MAYCKNCGAYVPDGQAACLACGTDQREDSAAGGGFAAQAQANEELRRKLEEQRRELEEEDRRLEEKRRRQEEDRRWAQAERERRDREQSQRRREAEGREQDQPQDWRDNSLFATLAYLPMLFVLGALFCNRDKYVMYHVKQGAILLAVTVAGETLGSIFGLGWIFNLLYIYLMFKGIGNARNGRMEPLPYIGRLIK